MTAPPTAHAHPSIDDALEPWPAAYRIETPRLMLRCFDPGDAPAIHAVLERCRDALADELELPAEPEPVEVMAARLIELRRCFDAGERFHYAVFAAERAEPAGSVSVEPIRGRGLLVGGWADPEMAGAGLGAAALAAVAQLAFELGAARYLELRTRPSNRISQRLAEAAGFHHEATLAGRLWSRGVADDEMIWTLRRPAHRGAAPRSVGAFDALGRNMYGANQHQHTWRAV